MSGTVFEWASVLIPTCAVIIGGLGVYAAFHPHQQERRQREKEIEDHLQRGENAINLIFGVKGDDGRGLIPQKGILERLADEAAEIQRIKDVLGVDGRKPPRSIMQYLEAADAERAENRRQIEALTRYLRRNPGDRDPRDEP